MQTTGEVFRLAIAAVSFTIACMAGDFFLPPFVAEMWVRDGDVGLWFSAGLLLTQLSVPGWLCFLKLGTIQVRLLGGIAFALVCILCAWGGFLQSGPVSQADAFAFIAAVFIPPILFVALDLTIVLQTGHRIDSCRNATASSAAFPREERLNEQALPVIARREWSFGLASMFGWVILVAIASALCRNAAGLNAVAYRDVRGLLTDSPNYTIARIAFLGVLHVGGMFATLSRDNRWAWALLVPGFILGLEGTRRIYFQATGITSTYLEWDFAMLAMGFLTGHVVLGTSLRFMGWTLRCG